MLITFVNYSVDSINVWASLLSDISKILAAFVLGYLFRFQLSRLLKKGVAVPLASAGAVPGGFIESFKLTQSLNWNFFMCIITVLFLVEYITSIAFIGLKADFVPVQGSDDTVLHLGSFNARLPYDILGDPVNLRTISKFERLVSEGVTDGPELRQAAGDDAVVQDFMAAIDNIARGSSVFLNEGPSLEDDPSLILIGNADKRGFTNSFVLYSENSFLKSINRTIPLFCSSNDGIEIQEERGQEEDSYGTFATTSFVPGCIYGGPRQTGIYGYDGDNDQVEVTGYVQATADADDVDENIGVYLSSETVDDARSTFNFPISGFPFTRDRVHPRDGRDVLEIKGVRFEDFDIPFQRVVMASGTIQAATTFKKDYFFVAQVKEGHCPPDPSVRENSECIAVLRVEGNVPEREGGESNFIDFNPQWGTELAALTATLTSIELLWFRNLSMQDQLLAAIAGVYGRNAAFTINSRRQRTLALNAIPAALFGTSTLRMAPSIDIVESATINGLFIFFIMIPIFISLIAGFVVMMKYQDLLEIPEDGLEVYQLGHPSVKESSMILAGDVLKLSSEGHETEDTNDSG